MFIHIGNGIVLLSRDIIAVLDYELFLTSVIMEEYEQTMRKEKKVTGQIKDAKSAIITEDRLYFSELSIATLKKRTSIESTISHLDDYSDDVSVE